MALSQESIKQTVLDNSSNQKESRVLANNLAHSFPATPTKKSQGMCFWSRDLHPSENHSHINSFTWVCS